MNLLQRIQQLEEAMGINDPGDHRELEKIAKELYHNDPWMEKEQDEKIRWLKSKKGLSEKESRIIFDIQDSMAMNFD